MWSFSFITVSSLALLQLFATGLVLPSNEAQYQHTNRSVNAQTQQELASIISRKSVIIGPTDADWINATERYMQNIKPRIQLSVRPGLEKDVPKIVSIVLHSYHW